MANHEEIHGTKAVSGIILRQDMGRALVMAWVTLANDLPTRLSAGGGTHIFFSAYVGWGPASTSHPIKNIRYFKHPKKIFEILATKKNTPILYFDFKKRPLNA